MTGINAPHGFVWPDGLPDCGLCDQPPNSPVHVTPSPSVFVSSFTTLAARELPKPQGDKYSRSHPYVLSKGIVDNIRCAACGQGLKDSVHPVGMPSTMNANGFSMAGGSAADSARTKRAVARDFTADQRDKMAGQGKAMPDGSFPIANEHDLRNAIQACGRAKDPGKAKAHIMKRAKALGLTKLLPEDWIDGGADEDKEVAFVANIGDRIILATRGRTSALDDLPPTLAAMASQKKEAQSANLWIAGRYVEADRPNRNMAYWSTDDLQLGQPTVDHGPINWLHEERHIIGALAHSEFVPVEREAAAETGVGSHIAALGALWPWIARDETRAILDASDQNRLWFSMECVSKQVACLEDDCTHVVDYKPYMRTPEQSRCTHMRNGGVRRFVDPTFEGAGIIVPPTQPGWANADARIILPKAESLVERNAAAFTGVSDEDAVRVVAALMGENTTR